tara:strand:- start:26 stop:559 length:534 start_codon:yes stop_codon:yes gene_type:complete
LDNEKANEPCANDDCAFSFRDMSSVNGMESDGNWFREGRFLKRETFGNPVADSGGNDNIVCERSLPAKVCCRDSKNFPVHTEIDPPSSTVIAFAAVNGAVKGDPVSLSPSDNVGSTVFNHSGCLMAHYQWRDSSSAATVHAVDVTSADPTGLYGYQKIIRTRYRCGLFNEFEGGRGD